MNDYIRLCPVCATEAAAEATQCAACGTLLLGVDLTLKTPPTAVPAPAAPVAVSGVRCPHADCGQENPSGSGECLYCGRTIETAVSPASTFYRLPTALADKFHIAEVLPAGGAEAEIMVLEGLGSGVKVIAKLYRPGLLPKSEVLERVSRAAFRHVVRLIAHGESDGVGYEVMEYCPLGSLRAMMSAELPRDRLRQIVDELTEALAALHELKVIHRDLKPENVLVRRLEPLDLVLTDFGIASVNDATQLFTSLARSVKYGAPETLAGVLDAAADWWSLGMIVVELLTGRHPFDGLSDAVITHQLVTGSVDVDTVADRDWRMLCRGLLLRDPKQRWSATEVRRWLAGDATLDMPVETTPAIAWPGARPYRIEGVDCRTPVELAAALATHWEAGRKDLMRGQLSAWVGQELKDNDLLRTIQDLLDLRDVSDDLRLFRLIRAMAPELPAVWRGLPLSCASLAAQAAQSEHGKAAAGDWLLGVFGQKLLRELPAVRFPEEAALAPRWEAAREHFEVHWRRAESALGAWRRRMTSHDGVADFDALVFGQPQALALPAAQQLHPLLVLMLVDETYAEALQTRLQNEAAPWRENAPWLAELLAGDGMATLVAHFLLPQARAVAEQLSQQEKHEVAAEKAQQTALVNQVNQALAVLRERCDLGAFANAVQRDQAAQALQGLLALLEEARLAGIEDDTPLMRTLHRAEPIVLRIQERLDEWAHAAQINAAWRNRNLMQGVGGFVFFLIVFAAELFPRLIGWIIAVPLLAVAWRFTGLMSLSSAIRTLAQALPLRIPSGGLNERP